MKGVVHIMGKAKKAEPFDPHNLSPQDQLKFEIGFKGNGKRMEEPYRKGKRTDRRPDYKA